MNNKVFAAPHPQSLSTVFPGNLMTELKKTIDLEYHGDGPVDYSLLDTSLEKCVALIGQMDLPELPVPEDHSVRQNENLLLSPHRAGGIPQAFEMIGRMQKAQWETVKSFASKPAG